MQCNAGKKMEPLLSYFVMEHINFLFLQTVQDFLFLPSLVKIYALVFVISVCGTLSTPESFEPQRRKAKESHKK